MKGSEGRIRGWEGIQHQSVISVILCITCRTSSRTWLDIRCVCCVSKPVSDSYFAVAEENEKQGECMSSRVEHCGMYCFFS